MKLKDIMIEVGTRVFYMIIGLAIGYVVFVVL